MRKIFWKMGKSTQNVHRVTDGQMDRRTEDGRTVTPSYRVIKERTFLPRARAETCGDAGDGEIEEEDASDGGAESDAAPTAVELVAPNAVVEQRGGFHLRRQLHLRLVGVHVRRHHHHRRLVHRRRHRGIRGFRLLFRRRLLSLIDHLHL